MRVVTKIGDIFSVEIDEEHKKYFQLIAFDLTQLNSDVIRAFREKVPISSKPDLLTIVSGEVEFYAHCVTKIGVKLNLWQKVGHINILGKTDIIQFRDSGDFGNSQIMKSEKWWIWKINEKMKYVGKLTGDFQKAEIGIIFNPYSIVFRMKNGFFDNGYPDF